MSQVYLARKRLTLRDQDLLGEGGEGRVYRSDGVAIKVFTAPNAARAAKLRAFPRALPDRVVAPIELCTNARGEVVGFSMRILDHAVDIQRLSQRRWREGRVGNAEVLRIFRDLSATVASVHARGVVVGDLNDGNVVLTETSSTPLVPWLIDADSMQFAGHPCVVAHERFLDPRLYGRDLSRGSVLTSASDFYALAVLLFGSLLYVHPFGGAHPSYPTLLRRAEARVSLLNGTVKRPAAAARPDILPDDALAWFEKVFEKDLREPIPVALLDARFTTCSCGAEHARRCCPMCTTRVLVAPVTRAAGRLRATRVFRVEGGHLRSAAFQGTLMYAFEKNGVLQREDGTVLPSCSGPVRVIGNTTWLFGAGRSPLAQRVVGGAVIEERPVAIVHGEHAADAGKGDLVLVHGDTLVRAERGTRVGQALEGQTRLRVGDTLGFAFYRAGDITVAFVFDTRKGPLRQVESFPHVEGKLVDWSAVFDDAHVLVTFATERAGRLVHTAHLLDASGTLLATDRGEVLPPSLTGRALSNGSVLAATDEGLVLARPDRAARSLAALRLFTEAKDFVSTEADLVVGPGGSLFVVSHDEITHLCFTE